ncbi:uncharacterized protein DMAD_11078 [Drosophila madeirensis]|uniref:MADF domain-containing protein n=1 Tax=Drosophila madeirensis TaxID=30013 RepID=A0AAU9FBU9_DROMD
MNRDIETCRNGWKSLRDSYRYHVKRVAKSGSAGGVPFKGPVASDSIDWRFAPHMEFLPDLSYSKQQQLFETYRVGLIESVAQPSTWRKECRTHSQYNV